MAEVDEFSAVDEYDPLLEADPDEPAIDTTSEVEPPPFPVDAYEGVADVPPEDPPPDEGDAGETEALSISDDEQEALAAAKPKQAKRRRVVRFQRTLKRGSVGPDVLALKRALHRANAYAIKPKGKITNQFGAACEVGVKKFQQRHKLAADGIYGIRTHRALIRYYDAFGALLMSRAPQTQGIVNLRERVVSEAIWGYNNAWRIYYAQVRPYYDRGHALPQTLDCSSFSTVVYKRAGAPDPNHFLYNGLGYTGTLSAHGIWVASSQARPGDLVFYGSGFPWHHVAIYVGNGRVVSHGSNSGPHLCYMDYRSDRGQIRSYLP